MAASTGLRATTHAEQEGVAKNPPLWRDPLLGLALLLTIFAVAPFLLPGYFWGANDARHHVYFLHQFNRLVADGIWWPRWSPDFAFGYGYPFFNIYGPLSHFLAELLLHFFGFGYTAAIKSIFGLSIVASAAAMYIAVRPWGGRHAALVSAVVYTYLPYHLLNLYVRANLAESMAFVWLPLCLWAVRGAVIKPGVRWVVAAALSYGALMLTSNLVMVLFTPLLGLYVLLVAWLHAIPTGTTAPVRARLGASARRAGWPIAGLAAGLGLSATFWIPAFLEQKYVLVDQWYAGRYDYRAHFVYLHQLFSSQWGFGVSEPGPLDPISFQIGAAALLLGALGLIVQWRRAGRVRWELAFYAGAALLALFFALQAAAPLWELPLLGTWLGMAQFPWRWYSVMAPFLSMLGGLLVARFPAQAVDPNEQSTAGRMAAAVALCAVVILASYPYLRVQISEPAEGPVSLAALMRFQQSSDEMTGSTAWVTKVPTWSPMADYYVQQEAAGAPDEPVSTLLDYSVFDYETFAADSVAHNSVSEEVYYSNRTEAPRTLIYNQFYYPGWRAFLLDGEHGAPLRELPITPERTGTLGRMTVEAPPGEGYILLAYGDTPTRIVGRWISWATIALLLAALGWTALRRARAARHTNRLASPTEDARQ